jgi:hypothetical protein
VEIIKHPSMAWYREDLVNLFRLTVRSPSAYKRSEALQLGGRKEAPNFGFQGQIVVG